MAPGEGIGPSRPINTRTLVSRIRPSLHSSLEQNNTLKKRLNLAMGLPRLLPRTLNLAQMRLLKSLNKLCQQRMTNVAVSHNHPPSIASTRISKNLAATIPACAALSLGAAGRSPSAWPSLAKGSRILIITGYSHWPL
jgi:hypothetical protein